MPFYLLQAAYATDAWVKMKGNPRIMMCIATIKPVVERHKGKFHNAWLSFGEYDTVCVTEMPDTRVP